MSNNNTISVVPNNINYKVIKGASFVTTSSFYEVDDEPLNLLDYDVSFLVYKITRSRETVLLLTNTSGLIIEENESTIDRTISLDEGKYLYKYTISKDNFSAVLQKGTFEVVEDSVEDSENEDTKPPCAVDPQSNITVTTGYFIKSPGDKHYTHEQGMPSKTWNVTHGLNKYPTAAAVDTAQTVVIGKIDYIDLNNLTITFNASFSGEAYLN
jgi:hypothetical protein